MEFWDITNRQDWAACESVQRGLQSPHFRPGPFAPNEDAVAQLVATHRRGVPHRERWRRDPYGSASRVAAARCCWSRACSLARPP